MRNAKCVDTLKELLEIVFHKNIRVKMLMLHAYILYKHIIITESSNAPTHRIKVQKSHSNKQFRPRKLRSHQFFASLLKIRVNLPIIQFTGRRRQLSLVLKDHMTSLKILDCCRTSTTVIPCLMDGN